MKIVMTLVLAVVALTSLSANAVSVASADNMTITKVAVSTSAIRGPNGAAYIYLDTSFPLPGGCLYAGNVNPALEFDTSHPAFKSMLSVALTAYASGKKIFAQYDDGFGSGTTCRLNYIQVQD